MGHQRTRDDRSLLDGGSGTRSESAEKRGGVWEVDRTESGNALSVGECRGMTAADESTDDEASDSVVRVDRDKLTDRQLEVIETAHEMGYYQYPRGSNATEVAEALDICPSTLAEHLAAAQTKLLEDVLGERAD